MDTSKLIFKIPYPDRAVFHWQPARLIFASFEQALSSGLTIEDATAYVLLDFQNMLEDENHAALAYVALAALQLAFDRLQPDIRNKALYYLGEERFLAVWLDTTRTEMVLATLIPQAFDSIRQKLGLE